MKSRQIVVGAVLALINLPAVLALSEAVSFHVRNRSNGAIESSGEKRAYLLHVPRGYDRTRPTPLVISLHGAGGWPVQQRDLSGWNRLADEKGFLVVYPSGVESAGPRVWHTAGTGLTKDVRFISDLIDKLEEDYKIDPARVYANGISNGGGMSFVLSCTLSDRIAAVGMVSTAQFLPWSWCTDRRAVPMVTFQGTADPMIPYKGGRSPIADNWFPNIPAWTASWARRNRCEKNSVDSAIAPDVTRIEYPGCADGADVVLYRIQGGGHTWPGGAPLPEWFAGHTSNGVDATRRMWEFFRDHPLRMAQAGADQN